MILLTVILYFVSNSIVDLTNGDVSTLKTSVQEEFIEAVKKIYLSRSIPKPETKDIPGFISGKENEDTYLSGPQIITKYGYPVEIHTVVTSDGYILNVFRIPCGGPPVFLMHGLITSSDDYIIAGPESAIGFSLAREGYDVWMGNARGNKYSRKHLTLSPDKDPEFWNFSWNEIGLIDLPSMIDYVLNKTGHEKVMYIGHSQGTTTFFVMCSEKPKYNDKISIMVAMGAVAYVTHVKSPIIRALALFEKELELPEVLGYNFEIFSNSTLIKTTTALICGNAGLAVIICSNFAFSLFGYDYAQINVTNLPNIFQHAPSGSSTKQVVHYIQEINSGKFQKFDYGKTKNIKIYGSPSAPTYALEKVTAPIFIFYSDNDWVADTTDVINTRNRLPNVVEFYRIPYSKFNHLDYFWAKDLKSLVFYKISTILEKYRPPISTNSTSSCPKQ